MSMVIEQFRNWRSRILEIMDELDLHQKNQEKANEVNGLIQPLRSRLLENRFQIVVVGEFSTGKSTFINALLGKDILPSSVRPTTAVLSYITDGDEGAVAHYHDGKQLALTLGELKSFATALDKEEEQKATLIKHIEITVPSPLTRDGVQLVDTTGNNELNQQRVEITYEMIPRADAAIMLMDARRVLKRSEREFIEQKLLENNIKKIFFVINFMDKFPLENQDEILDYTKSNLTTILKTDHAPKVFGVASKAVLEYKLGNTAATEFSDSFQEFETNLLDFLVHDKGNVMLYNITLRLNLILQHFILQLNMKREALNIPLKELEEKQEKFKILSGQLKDDKNLLISEIRKSFNLIPDNMNKEIRQVVAGILNELENVEFNSLKKAGIEAKIKEAVKKRLKSELENILIPKVLEQCQYISKNTDSELRNIFNKIKQYQIKEFTLADPQLLEKDILMDSNDEFNLMIPLIGFVGLGSTLFSTFFALLFGPIFIIIAAILMVVALVGFSDKLMTLTSFIMRGRIINNVKKKEHEIVNQISSTILEQLAIYAEEMVSAINEQIDGELTRIRLTLENTVQIKGKLEIEMELVRNSLDQELEQISQLQAELLSLIHTLGNENNFQRLEGPSL